jgi:hypothetical protein
VRTFCLTREVLLHNYAATLQSNVSEGVDSHSVLKKKNHFVLGLKTHDRAHKSHVTGSYPDPLSVCIMTYLEQ